ncbi:MAG TPA: sigma-70 family RNA polymerase sigma factor [Opitutaceae bacterium]|nr:sigma-70 family RNA polymerase sigma factor [Opitutaceae bacterium]
MTDVLDDIELLRRYAEKRSEVAFAELVRRHINLVYHAALRQTGGDGSLAEEVTQTVFTDLARKARSLSGRPVITGWLFTSTRFAAAKARRTELRRQTRETAAHVMQEITRDSGAAADWERLRPVIDEVLYELDERDREAVLLRFFEDRPFAEIGERLSLTEDTARVRVARALDKMHTRLARRGVTSTTMALAAALGAQTVLAAPAGLAVAVANTALAAASGAAMAGVFGFFSGAKIAGGMAVVALTVGAIVYLSDQSGRTNAPFELAQVSNPGLDASPAGKSTEFLAVPQVSTAVPAPAGRGYISSLISDPNYILRVGDAIHVRVHDQPKFGAAQWIGPRGEISLWYTREQLFLGGKTIRDAGRLVENMYREKRLLKAPVVSIVVHRNVRPWAMVQGAVHSPGKVEFPPGALSLPAAEILSRAGGFLPTAKPDAVRVIRSGGGDGNTATQILNLEKVTPPRSDSDPVEFLIYPGDSIWVPERYSDQPRPGN